MCEAGEFSVEFASYRLDSRRLPVNFALCGTYHCDQGWIGYSSQCTQ